MKRIISLIIIVLLWSSAVGSIAGSFIPIESSNIELSNNKEWTLLVYFCCDNDLIGINSFDFFSDDNLNVIALEDTRNGPGIMWYFDEQGTMVMLEEIGEVNMGDPITLNEFITYGKENYPAERYMLYLFDHGGGWRGICWDWTDDDHLTMHELKQALIETGGTNIVSLQACLMAQLESVYELRDCTDVYIGCEESTAVWQHAIENICQLLNNQPTLSTLEIGEQIIEYLGEDPYYPDYTFSAIRTDKILQLKDAVNSLCKNLLKKWFRSSFKLVQSAHDDTYIINLHGAETFQSYDLYDFTQNLLEEEIDSTTQHHIEEVQDALNQAVIAECHGANQNGCYGLSIYFPNRLMDNYYTLLYGLRSYRLDFPKDTFWNEFLGIFVLTSVILG